jgi:hypothetical protein
MLFPEVPIIGGHFKKRYTISSATSTVAVLYLHLPHRSDKIFRLRSPYYYRILSNPSEYYDFYSRFCLLDFTLGAGFKGGEVTLFLLEPHCALSTFVPLPCALAGMGFVAVFLSYHTPIACTVMGIELFGIESGLFVGLACFIAYLASGQ